MPGQQQRHQLVSHLAIGQALAVLVLGQEQGREHVVAARERLVPERAPARDLCVQHLVDVPARGRKAIVQRGLRAAEEHRQRRQQGQRPWPGQRFDHRAHASAKVLLGGTRLVAEHRLHDHPEGQRLHAGQQRERLAHRPGVDLEVGRAAHRVGEGLHAPAVERRQHQPAVAQVLGAVEQQHGALADHGPEHRVGLAGAELLARSLKELLDERRVEHHHEPAVEQGPERHRIAEAAPAGVDEPGRGPEHEARGLEDPRQARARRQSRLDLDLIVGSRRRGALRVAMFTCDGRTPRWCSALVLGLGVRPWCSALVFGLGARPWCSPLVLGLRGGRPALEIGERQLVAGRAVERPGDRHVQVGIHVEELSGRERTPARVLVHRLAGHHDTPGGRPDRPSARAPSRAGWRGRGGGLRLGHRPRARARTARARRGSAAPTAPSR